MNYKLTRLLDAAEKLCGHFRRISEKETGMSSLNTSGVLDRDAADLLDLTLDIRTAWWNSHWFFTGIDWKSLPEFGGMTKLAEDLESELPSHTLQSIPVSMVTLLDNLKDAISKCSA